MRSLGPSSNLEGPVEQEVKPEEQPSGMQEMSMDASAAGVIEAIGLGGTEAQLLS